ncbi:hypothetical protein CPB85DRAFT_1564234 [Mucidula mucida]|nr:hypothetical protein CPB85DRAFT_1564234 [Mucidula mucida]
MMLINTILRRFMSSQSEPSQSVPGLWDDHSLQSTFQESIPTWKLELCSDFFYNERVVVTAAEHRKKSDLWQHEFLAVQIFDRNNEHQTVVFIDRDFDDKKKEELPYTSGLVSDDSTTPEYRPDLIKVDIGGGFLKKADSPTGDIVSYFARGVAADAVHRSTAAKA